MKSFILFSGGKDSFYSLIKTMEAGTIEYLVSVRSVDGNTQLHAGPEVTETIRKAQLDLLGIPCKEIEVGSGKTYLRDLFVELHRLVREDGITHVVTGDLWHPYTSGIGDMLAGALGVTLIRPAREACPTRTSDTTYLKNLISMGIESIIVSVRQGDVPATFVGRVINGSLVEKLVSMGVDAAAESGEYQSFVVAAPLMKGKLSIDDFFVTLVDGKNEKEKFHRMVVNKYHIVT